MKTCLNNTVNIVTALDCEARAIIDCFKLKKQLGFNAYPVYHNADNTLHLIVSGIGQINSAAATTALHFLSGGQTHATWLNIGIAGAQASVGETFIANKITSAGTGKSFYPSTFTLKKIPGKHLITFTQPQQQYPEDAMIDMEAFAFFQATSKLANQEQIHCMKIISDNSDTDINSIKPKLVETLIQEQLEKIDYAVNQLRQLSNLAAKQKITLMHLNNVMQHCHFTQYQVQQLQELLRRWQVVHSTGNPMTLIQEARNAKTVLALLTQELDNIPYSWS